jgi:hypothetical protein
MKNLFYLLLILSLGSCQQKTAEPAATVKEMPTYPASITKVFDAHGGVDQWAKMQSLSYEIVKEEKNEEQIIDLNNRNERIEGADFISGYDGTNYWLEADTSYQGNVKFYKNLIFYFYAMPFVVADPGVNYDTADDLIFDGVSYPGIRISYDDGIGISPKDEYFIHYDAETHQMEWLGYTVTFRSQETSTAVKWIRYDDWQMLNGLKLPKSIAWYTLEENLPVAERNRREFVNIKLSQTALPASTFAMTEGAEVVE